MIDRRYDADYVTLSKLVKNGSLGRVVEYETHFDRHRPELATSTTAWKTKITEAGAIYDLGVHLLDQAVHLFGLPKRITAFVGSQRVNNPTGLEDSFTTLLHYDSGLLVTVKAAVVSPEEKQLRFWVRGDKGSFKKFHLDIQEDQLKAGVRPGDSGYGLEPSDRYGMFIFSEESEEKAKKRLIGTNACRIRGSYHDRPKRTAVCRKGADCRRANLGGILSQACTGFGGRERASSQWCRGQPSHSTN